MGVRCYLSPVTALAEIENPSAVFRRELAELERIIRKARREKEHTQKPSLRDADPVSVGRDSQTDWDTRRVV